jgi:hypothetical protein
MTPTNQTRFSAFTSKGERITYGNCLVACIASVLDVDIHEVPNLYTLYGITRPQPPDAVDTPYWAEVLNMWMRDKHGKELEIMTAIAYASRVTKDPNYPRTAIVKGMSHRDKPHCCIYHLSTLIWDPHPSREGLKEMKHVYVIKSLADAPVKQPLPEFTIDHDKIEHYALYGKGEFPLDPAKKIALEVEQMQKERESRVDPLQAIEERKKALAELHEEEKDWNFLQGKGQNK